MARSAWPLLFTRRRLSSRYYTEATVPSIRTQNSNPSTKNYTLHRKAEELALEIQSHYPTHYNLLLFLWNLAPLNDSKNGQNRICNYLNPIGCFKMIADTIKKVLLSVYSGKQNNIASQYQNVAYGLMGLVFI